MSIGYGKGWAEIERGSRLGYWITAGYGTGRYEKTWFRFTHKAARQKAERLIDYANREHKRHQARERLGYR